MQSQTNKSKTKIGGKDAIKGNKIKVPKVEDVLARAAKLKNEQSVFLEACPICHLYNCSLMGQMNEWVKESYLSKEMASEYLRNTGKNN